MARRIVAIGEMVSLWQAVHWIAFDCYGPTKPDSSIQAITEAKWQLLEALRAGELEATGIIDAFPHPTPTREVISREFWAIGTVFWDQSTVETWARQYIDLTVARGQLEQIWPASIPPIDLGARAGLKSASEMAIHAAISEVYAAAKLENRRPPNIKEVASDVRQILEMRGFKASDRQIQSCAALPKHAGQRLRPGQRWSRTRS